VIFLLILSEQLLAMSCGENKLYVNDMMLPALY